MRAIHQGIYKEMEKEKGCSTAYLDSSPTVITAFTELGGAEPLVEVLKGCEELSCSQYSALNNSTYTIPIQYSMVAYRQTTETSVSDLAKKVAGHQGLQLQKVVGPDEKL